MKRIYLIAGIVIGLALSLGSIANATFAPISIPAGGTGTTTVPISQLLYGGGTSYQSVATTTASCSGNASCSTFTIIGSSPITISASGGGGGSGTVGTSTNETAGQLSYWTTNSATPALLGQVATATASCSGNASCTPFTIIGSSNVSISASGGTGTGLSTSSPVSGGNLLEYSSAGSGSALGVATTSITLSAPLSGSFTAVGASGSLGWNGLATTSNISANQVLYATSGSGVAGIATTTLSGSGLIGVTAGAVVIGASPISVSCATCGTGSVTSVASGNGIQGGAITTTGTLNLISYLATSSSETTSNLAYWTTTSGNPAKLGTVATTSLTFSGFPANLGGTTLGALVGGSGNATLTYWGLATSSAGVISNIPYFTSTSGLGNVATSAETCSSPLSCTGFNVIGTGGGAVTIQNADTTHTGALASTDWNTFNSKQAPGFQISTSSISVSQLAYYTGTTPTAISGVATSSLALSFPFSGSFTYVGSGGSVGWNGISTSSAASISQLPYWTSANQLGSVATSTLTPTGPLTGSFTHVGAGSLGWSGLATTSAISVSQLLYGTSASGVASVATSSLSLAGPFGGSFTYVGTGGTLTWNGVATSSTPSISNLAYWTSAAGGIGTVATSGETCSSPLSCTGFNVVGSGGGAITIQNADSTHTGALTSTDWSTFNNKQAPGFQISTSSISISNLAYYTGTTPTTISGIATTSVTCTGSASCTGFTVIGSSPITINATGGSASAAGNTNDVQYNSGSATFAGSDSLIFDGTHLGIGSTSPFALLSVMAGSDYASHAASTLFAIGSSTAGTATTTLFAIDSNGTLTIQNSGATAFRVTATTTNPFLGIATSSPFATLSLVGDGTDALFAIASSSGTGSALPVFMVDKNGHVITSGPPPVVTKCGTSPSITGNDTNGLVTTGTAGPTSCIVTFAKAYATAPNCVIGGAGASATSDNGALISSTTASQLSFMASTTLAFKSMTSWKVNYICFGNQ